MASLSEALETHNVVAALADAWNKTQADRVEYGGWIYLNNSTEKYCVKQTTDNQQSAIILTREADLNWFATRGHTIISDFHCHPNYGHPSGKPSNPDISGASKEYHRLVFTLDTNTVYDDRIYNKAYARPTPDGFPDGAIMWQIK